MIRASLLSPPPRPPPPPITSKLTSVDSGFDDLYVFVDTPVGHLLLLLLVNLNVHAHNSTTQNNTSATRSRYPYVPVTFTLNCMCARAKFTLTGESERVVARGRREMRLALEIYFVSILDNKDIRQCAQIILNRSYRTVVDCSFYTYTQFSRGPRFLLFCAEVNREADRVLSRFECGTRCQFFLVPPFVPLPLVLMYLTVATLPHIRYQ